MICVNEIWYEVLVVAFWLWQITSLIFGLLCLAYVIYRLVCKHKEHVQLVEDNNALIHSIINELGLTYVPRCYERPPYVNKPRKKQ